MSIFNTISYILIGMISGRAINNKDWITFVIAIFLFIVSIIDEVTKKAYKDKMKEIKEKSTKA